MPIKPYQNCPLNNLLLETFTYVAESRVIPQPKSQYARREMGLFAREFIAAGQFIGAYTGETTTSRRFYGGECERHTYIKWLDKTDPDNPVFVTGKSGVEFPNRIGIDGHCDLRYANHSREDFNMAADSDLFYAIRDIKPGEELLWKYGNFDFDEPKSLRREAWEWLKKAFISKLPVAGLE